jgi:hypothetical protein
MGVTLIFDGNGGLVDEIETEDEQLTPGQVFESLDPVEAQVIDLATGLISRATDLRTATDAVTPSATAKVPLGLITDAVCEAADGMS